MQKQRREKREGEVVYQIDRQIEIFAQSRAIYRREKRTPPNK